VDLTPKWSEIKKLEKGEATKLPPAARHEETVKGWRLDRRRDKDEVVGA